MVLVQLLVIWLAVSVGTAVVVCALCKAGHEEDERLGYVPSLSDR